MRKYFSLAFLETALCVHVEDRLLAGTIVWRREREYWRNFTPNIIFFNSYGLKWFAYGKEVSMLYWNCAG